MNATKTGRCITASRAASSFPAGVTMGSWGPCRPDHRSIQKASIQAGPTNMWAPTVPRTPMREDDSGIDGPRLARNSRLGSTGLVDARMRMTAADSVWLRFEDSMRCHPDGALRESLLAGVEPLAEITPTSSIRQSGSRRIARQPRDCTRLEASEPPRPAICRLSAARFRPSGLGREERQKTSWAAGPLVLDCDSSDHHPSAGRSTRCRSFRRRVNRVALRLMSSYRLIRSP
jgi:hypothetical protein